MRKMKEKLENGSVWGSIFWLACLSLCPRYSEIPRNKKNDSRRSKKLQEQFYRGGFRK